MFSDQNVREFRWRLLRWYERNGRDLPWRRTRDPYAILVSEAMLQQTQVSTVLPYYYRWLDRFPNFQSLAKATESEVLHAWQGLGYYSRARNLHAAARQVVRHHNSVLPRDPEKLRKLPGIGNYTANAIATFAFNQPLPIVEANITRVIARLFNIKTPVDSSTGRTQLWEAATSLVPLRNAGKFNSALMDLGALVCRRIPQCNVCPVHSFCRAKQPELLPIKKPPLRLKRLTESHAFIVRRGRILLEQCSARWRGMWMLPRFQTNGSAAEPIHSSVFPFTNHQITLRVFGVGSDATGKRSLPSTLMPQAKTIWRSWMRTQDLANIPIPSPHRRAINACLSLDVGR